MVRKTKLQQQSISDSMDAGPRFSQINEDGTCPLVLVPPERWSCSTYLRVPEDVFVVMQKWGQDIDPLPPGFHWLPPWYRIAFLVTKQENSYNAPVMGCPTDDNVKVQVDLSLSFVISSPRDFVYKLGAMRFDELLHAATEEGIRGLVRRTTIDQVYELRGSKADEMLNDLNEKFKDFGVHFTSVVITSVEMPAKLAKSLESATVYDSKIAEHVKNFEFRMQELENRSAKEQREVDIKNGLLKKELEATKEQAQIVRDGAKIEAIRHKETALLRAEELAHVNLITAEADLKNSKARAAKDIVLKKQDAESRKEAHTIAAEQQGKTIVIHGEKDLKLAEDRAEGLLAKAEAEEVASQMFVERRAHELELARLEVLQKLAHKGKVMISGENGDRLISAIMETTQIQGKA